MMIHTYDTNNYENFWQCATIDVPLCALRKPDCIYVPMHWHDCCEIIMVTSGEIQVTIANQPYTLCSGDLIIINSNELHSIQGISENTSIVFSIPDTFWEKHTAQNPLPKFPNLVTGAAKEKLSASLLRIGQAFEDMQKGNSLTYYRELFDFISLLLDRKSVV